MEATGLVRAAQTGVKALGRQMETGGGVSGGPLNQPIPTQEGRGAGWRDSHHTVAKSGARCRETENRSNCGRLLASA